MAPKELNFITGNKNKLAEVQAILSATPVKLQNQSIDLPELQGTIEEISRDKALRAAEVVSIYYYVCKKSTLMSIYLGERTSLGRGYVLVL